jgi:hypothetical protein
MVDTPIAALDFEETRAQLQQVNPAVWVMDNKFINENQELFEFDNHRFMIQPYSDSSPDQVIMKSAQVGWSVLAILKSIHAAYYLRLNVIYVLPTRNASAEFVVPKVNPMLKRNPVIAAMVRDTDNKTLKAVGDRFIYFKGAFHQGEAISTSADLIVSDENDRSNQTVLNTYQSRLQASKYGWFWRFSNPSIPSFGVHELYQASDQMHWFVKCSHCNYESYLDFEKAKYAPRPNHYVEILDERKDFERGFYACGACGKEITDNDRQSGRWIPKFPKRSRRGYWINQLMVPWVSAVKILQQRNTMDIDVFYNFVLGLPYQAAEYMINREAILRNSRPGVADKSDVALGCDSGKVKHWVLGNAEGIFTYGKTTDWGDIERLIKMYNATTVIDALPDFTVPEELARKYLGQVFVHYYKHDTKDLDVSSRKEGEQFGVIQSDRTKLLDRVAADITNGSTRFFQDAKSLDELITHFENIYRVVEENTRGIKVARWEKKPNRPDHFAHATAYYKVALSLSLRSDEVGGVLSQGSKKQRPAPYVDPVTQTVKVEEVLGMPLDQFIEKSIAKNRKRRVK